jgi:hypothetical protein
VEFAAAIFARVADQDLVGGDEFLAQEAADYRLAHGAGADHADA